MPGTVLVLFLESDICLDFSILSQLEVLPVNQFH